MIVSRKFLSHKIWQKLSLVKILVYVDVTLSFLGKEAKLLSTLAQTKPEPLNENDDLQKQTDKESSPYANYRFIYPEFLPDPNPIYRNSLREKLERMDMLARRAVLNIPEFYVGSILAVTHSEQHAPGKINKFVGICILREGSGLRTSFILRNVINGESIEINYNLYDPTIQKIDCLRLEKRLDNELLYLRDAPLEYSTFPSDMEADLKPAGFVLLNEMKVPLNSPPWLEKWERKNLKGIKDLVVSRKRQRKAAAVAKPWEKYDLMKTYRETIPEEEQVEIFADVYTELRHLEVQKNLLTRKNILDRQKKDKDKPLV